MADNKIHDTIIIGGGPAGLTAGLYAARARLDAVLLERMGFGGQLLTYEKVENYPGFPEGIGAFGLAELISAQALRFGLGVRNAEVVGLDVGGAVKKVILTNGTIETKTIIIASGASPTRLGAKGEIELTGRGVSYCAVCDAPFFRGQEVAVNRWGRYGDRRGPISDKVRQQSTRCSQAGKTPGHTGYSRKSIPKRKIFIYSL